MQKTKIAINDDKISSRKIDPHKNGQNTIYRKEKLTSFVICDLMM